MPKNQLLAMVENSAILGLCSFEPVPESDGDNFDDTEETDNRDDMANDQPVQDQLEVVMSGAIRSDIVMADATQFEDHQFQGNQVDNNVGSQQVASQQADNVKRAQNDSDSGSEDQDTAWMNKYLECICA